jgi:magnesium-protoporphyrin IX monomethyl ester (oxidative) cyclase
MRVLFVHPGPLMYSEIYLRLEPLGLERVAQAVRMAGHEVRLLDLQTFGHPDFARALREFQPRAIGFSLNYLANVPEVIDLAKSAKQALKDCFVFVGGHSGSFIAEELLEHGGGALDCVLRGEGEISTPLLLAAIEDGGLDRVPGSVTAKGRGPAPVLLENIDKFPPARDLLARRRNYFIGVLDPCASIEFTRGCPWDCSFCSAWTFYGRSYRMASAQAAAEDLAAIAEPNVFIVDDVAFIHPEHGYAIGREIERRGIRKQYYLETRADVLIRNQEVFAYWKKLGLRYLFLGLEAIDEEGLKAHRKRSSTGVNFEALEIARRLGINVAINLITDPDWDAQRFAVVREWALSIPEIVHFTVATPYPGTELWLTEARKLTTQDYRLFDIQHAVLPTKLPLLEFYTQLVETQRVIAKKHLGAQAMRDAAGLILRLALKGQTNFARSIWKFDRVYNAKRQFADHQQPVTYAIRPPPPAVAVARDPAQLYVHPRAKRPAGTAGSAVAPGPALGQADNSAAE